MEIGSAAKTFAKEQASNPTNIMNAANFANQANVYAKDALREWEASREIDLRLVIAFRNTLK